jgi:hypothetical protein
VGIIADLDDSFQASLKPHGFVKVGGPGCSYLLRRADPPSDLYVDVHVFSDPACFSVVLQDVRPDSQRRELLEEFEGLRHYSFDEGDVSSLVAARNLALEHLRRYGVPWLLGHSVSTPALEARAALAAEDRQRRLVAQAKASFHSGERQRARSLLEEAEGIGPLDPVAGKILSLLRK